MRTKKTRKADSEPEAQTKEKPPIVVGIGASAGGLAALRRFFERIPDDSGLTFVVVVHLSPQHKSHLADLLQAHVKMPVQQVSETVQLVPNTVFVIPPGSNISAIDTHLRLSDLESSRRERAPVDHFFRTLAETHDGHAIAVILTGTGSDGTLGIKEIKQKGGLTVVQDPNDAEYDGMPQSAVASGQVDLVLPLNEIPEAIIKYSRTSPRVLPLVDRERPTDEAERYLHAIFAQLRARTHRDFSRYKRSTIGRRIERRMQLHQIEDLGRYVTFLRENAEEARILADDLLITVTSFFRDPEVFARLESDVIPALFRGKGPDDTIRIWVVGCASGEEAYSFAILLMEEAARHPAPPSFQVFASDLHEQSLAAARDGFYPGDISTDVSKERLQRYFVKETGGYRIRKEVREAVVFAPHNLLADPPFSRLDLISCRNLLIYLQREVQGDVSELFHYALNSGGYLLVGTSETIENPELFRVVDKQLCLYAKRNVPTLEPRLPVFPVTYSRLEKQQTSPTGVRKPVAYSTLHQRLVERYAPPSVLIGPDDRVVHLSENAGRYLVHPGGEITNSIFKIVREELQMDLKTALHSGRQVGRPVRTKSVPVRFNGETHPVVIDVRPIPDAGAEEYMLVIFDERTGEQPLPDTGKKGESEQPHGTESQTGELEAELEFTRRRLRATIEQYETSQEEMKASNEELQSMNEELRSTMEELETSKEELQSMNEELQTVNQENRHKVDELAQLSSDLQNLLAATDIATLFLDRSLRIMRFTPVVVDLFNIRMADRGRPISDLTHRLGYEELATDARSVIEKLVPVEREVPGLQDEWYMTRILPYRSVDDKIEGVVITFVDISSRKRAEDELRRSERLQTFLLLLGDTLRPLVDPIEIQSEAVRLLGEHLEADRACYAESDTDPQQVHVHTDYAVTGMKGMVGSYNLAEWPGLRRAVQKGTRVVIPEVAESSLLHSRERKQLESHDIRSIICVPLLKDSRLLATLTVAQAEYRDWQPEEVNLVTDTAERTWASVARARAELALRHSERKYRALFESMDEGFAIVEIICDDDGRPSDYRFVELNPGFEKHTGFRNALGKRIRELVPDIETFWIEAYGEVARTGEPKRFDGWSDALGRWFDVYAFKVNETSGRVAVLFNDITGRITTEEALRESEQKFRAVAELVPDLLWDADRSGKRTWNNRRWLEYTGQSEEDVAGDGWVDVVHPDDRERVAKKYREAMESGNRYRDELRIRSADGAYRAFLMEVLPVRDEGGRITRWFGAATDFEEQHTARETLEEHVNERTRQVRDLASRLTMAEQEERRRLSQVLHDDLQQILFGVALKIKTLDQRLKPEESTPLKTDLEEANNWINRAVEITRQLTADLEAPIFENTSIAEVLGWLEHPMRQVHGLNVTFSSSTEGIVESEEIRILLYRIVRELLFNVKKHAKVSRAKVEIFEEGDQLVIRVADEGSGFDPDTQDLLSPGSSSFGLAGSRERLRLIGADMLIRSTPGKGTTIEIHMPVSKGEG